MKGLLRQEDLARYADAVVKVGLSVGRGDDLLVTCQPLHRELAVAVVEAAYRARVRSVEVEYVDPLVRAAYLRSAPDSSIGHVPSWRAARMRSTIKPETATLWIAGESEPGALNGIPGERLAADLTRSQQRFAAVRRASRIGKRRWAIAAWATPAWAESVYPEVDERGCAAPARAGPAQLLPRRARRFRPASKGFARTSGDLSRRSQTLTRLKLEKRRAARARDRAHASRSIRRAVWIGGGMKNFYGKQTAPNLPTEECFTSPVASATEGTFRCSRPLMFQGRLIDGIAGEFRGGRLVRLDAKRKADREFLAGFLFSIDNADRLGEVALVDSSSRIGRAGRTYYNTLLDENAAAHIAFGSGFEHTRADFTRRTARDAESTVRRRTST